MRREQLERKRKQEILRQRQNIQRLRNEKHRADDRRRDALKRRHLDEKRRALEEKKRQQAIRKRADREHDVRRSNRIRLEKDRREKFQKRRDVFEQKKRQQNQRKKISVEKRRQLFEKERLKRREFRRRYQQKVRHRNKADLRKLRKRRELIRHKVEKRYNRKLRAKQLKQAKQRLEYRRKRDRLRRRNSDINELRRELRRKRISRIVSRRGKIIDFEMRDYRHRKHRYRDLGRRRYRNGLHIYLTPPAGAIVGWNLYMIDGTGSSLREIEDVFYEPMAVDIDETYTVNEVIEDPEIRRKVRSVNLDAITFPSGSSEITEAQLETLDNVAQAIANTLDRRPRALFLIEGHTDAVGSEEFNQSLSEDRAAAVKDALIVQYGIPAQNLIDVGYGEEFLKIDTEYDEEENRRVAIRNISPLVGQRYSRRRR